ncbi:hypothetical protein D9758_011205 [Tetrapyrgos nigripes]|uniref:Uncharacterized protein n=1 Tax=Tetrapyrgos nigripes TaxID=182062 RepID=A0A8H5FZ37_9AGAR|nr:hypothetical protein D9758_011205 [Tetrapyrgos nigripes]
MISDLTLIPPALINQMPSEKKRSSGSNLAPPRPRRTRTYWTKEEDGILISAVETFAGSPSQWSEIAKCLEGRSPKDCRKRWANGLNTSLKKGSWTADEDTKLRQAVLAYNYDWARISKVVGNRSGDQCSKRWREVVDPSINKDPWTPEEDELLLKLFAKHGSAWQEIKEHFRNRRGLQCRNRCCHLLGTRSKKGRPKLPRFDSLRESPRDSDSLLVPSSVSSPQSSSSSPCPPTPSPLLLNMPMPVVSVQFTDDFPLEGGFSLTGNFGEGTDESNYPVKLNTSTDFSPSPVAIVPLHDFAYAPPEWSAPEHGLLSSSASHDQLHPTVFHSTAPSFDAGCESSSGSDWLSCHGATVDPAFDNLPETRSCNLQPVSTMDCSSTFPVAPLAFTQSSAPFHPTHYFPSYQPPQSKEYSEEYLLRFLLHQTEDPSLLSSYLRGPFHPQQHNCRVDGPSVVRR